MVTFAQARLRAFIVAKGTSARRTDVAIAGAVYKTFDGRPTRPLRDSLG